MTQADFIAICEYYGIDPALALENADLVKALKARDAIEVERILRDEF